VISQIPISTKKEIGTPLLCGWGKKTDLSIVSATIYPHVFPILDLKQAIACLSESDFRSAAATEPAGLV
jgi:hypothetical protein